MSGTPRARNGQIKAQWGKLANHEPGIVYARGDGTSRSDSHLLHNLISSPRFYPLSKEWDKSFVEELDARGYDIKTLKISVEKKKTHERA